MKLVRELLDSASHGDKSAQAKLKRNIEKAVLPPGVFGTSASNRRLAKDYYMYGASLDVPKAMFHLGNFYCSGDGQEKRNRSECMRWHSMAAERGYAPSMGRMSEFYEFSSSGDDKEKFRRWLLQAAESGFGPSMLKLASRYEKGEDFPVDPKLADYWYQKAEAAGEETPAVRARRNRERIEEIKSAAQGGDVEAMYVLGRTYTDWGYLELKLPTDYAEAARWYESAATKGHGIAANDLGDLFAKGYRRDVNFDEAMKWYRLGAELGYSRAMFNVAELFEDGNGRSVDIPSALAWYKLGNDFLSSKPGQWPFDGPVLSDMVTKPCRLSKALSRTDKAAADKQYAALSKSIVSPIEPSDRLISTPAIQELCERSIAR